MCFGAINSELELFEKLLVNINSIRFFFASVHIFSFLAPDGTLVFELLHISCPQALLRSLNS